MTPHVKARYLRDQYRLNIEMLRWTSDRLSRPSGGSPMHSYLVNALIDSFCMHARCLIAFYDKPQKQSDIVAEDFCPGFAAGENLCHSQVMMKLDQHIACMSSLRANAEPVSPTDRRQLRGTIEGKHAKFHAELPENLAILIPARDERYVI